uniref:CDP-diacylglycerol--serine O-phosphatidyltransferase n=1 Tax=uncultured myxobacterium HF0130_06F04 TaxID=723555 RepID=E7C2G8_9BACT|nr:phosphatidylserine synthase [uncultured myxobacterium HF0130_06F04]
MTEPQEDSADLGRKKRRRLNLPFDLGKAMFVLPNLFTLSSVFCGIYAIIQVSNIPTPEDLSRACLAVFFAAFFDMADGRVARLTKTQSEFGVQLDSLADAVSFGVAPAIIVYKWGLTPLGLAGLVIAFIYVGCGLIRLARFNVLAAREDSPSDFFLGVPIPLAAGMLMSVVMFHQHTIAAPAVKIFNVAFLTVAMSLLMVSNVRYRNFKNVKSSPGTLALLGTLLLAFVGLALVMHASFSFLVYFSGYIIMGLLEQIIRFKRKLFAGPEALKTEDDNSEPDDQPVAS